MKRPRESVDSRESSPESQQSHKSARSNDSASTRDDAEPTYGMMFGTQLSHMRLSDLWRWRHPYKRVRMMRYEDIESAYPYICGCIEDPRIADGLEELVIGNGHWDQLSWYNSYLTDENRPVREAREGTHDKLLSHVRGLGLSAKVTDRMVAALEWKKQIYLGVQPETSGGGVWMNMEFAAAACVVILSLCHNIATVHIDEMLTKEGEHNAIRHDILGGYLLKNNFGMLANPGLQKLTSVVVNPLGGDNGDHLYMDVGVTDIMQCFHRLPALQSFHFIGVNVDHATRREFLPPGTGNFKKLRFDHIDLRGTMIGTMIRVAKALEEVILSLGGMDNFDGSCIWVHPKTVGKALLEQKSTLRVLDLDIREAKSRVFEQEHQSLDETCVELKEGNDNCMIDEWHKLDEATGSGSPLLIEDLPNTRHYGLGLGSLHDFEALTHLSIHPAKLHGGPGDEDSESDSEKPRLFPVRRLVDMLPPSLEYLCLYGYKKGEEKWLDDQVEELMAKKAEKLPNLKEVKGYDELVTPSDDSADPKAEGGRDTNEESSGNEDDEEDEEDDTDSEADGYWKRPRPDFSWLKA